MVIDLGKGKDIKDLEQKVEMLRQGLADHHRKLEILHAANVQFREMFKDFVVNSKDVFDNHTEMILRLIDHTSMEMPAEGAAEGDADENAENTAE